MVEDIGDVVIAIIIDGLAAAANRVCAVLLRGQLDDRSVVEVLAGRPIPRWRARLAVALGTHRGLVIREPVRRRCASSVYCCSPTRLGHEGWELACSIIFLLSIEFLVNKLV